MEMNKKRLGRITLKVILLALVAAFFWRQAFLAARLLLGGFVAAFLLEPLVCRFARHMRRPYAVGLGVFTAAVGLLALMAALLPPLVRQSAELIRLAPDFFKRIKPLLDSWSDRLRAFGLPWEGLQNMDMSGLAGGIGGMAAGAADAASGLFERGFHLALMLMLGVYFMIDKPRLMLQTELLVPAKYRQAALKMADGVMRELRAYLRGQLTVCLIVAALAASGLALIGIRSPLALGALVGLFNIIPYFGPVLGGIPAVVAALSQGLIPALLSVAVLFIVQQLDGMVISPRVMSGVTGMPPAAVLLSLTLAADKWGVAGMLFALPLCLIVRICIRVWATRNEVIENRRKV